MNSHSLIAFGLQELPNALLPVANRPVLSYALELLELSNLKDLIVVPITLISPYFLFFFYFYSLHLFFLNIREGGIAFSMN